MKRLLTSPLLSNPSISSLFDFSFLLISSQLYRYLLSLPSAPAVGWRSRLGFQSFLCIPTGSNDFFVLWSPESPPRPRATSYAQQSILEFGQGLGSGERSQETGGRFGLVCLLLPAFKVGSKAQGSFRGRGSHVSTVMMWVSPS